jgi:hypothetical protein
VKYVIEPERDPVAVFKNKATTLYIHLIPQAVINAKFTNTIVSILFFVMVPIKVNGILFFQKWKKAFPGRPHKLIES